MSECALIDAGDAVPVAKMLFMAASFCRCQGILRLNGQILL